MKNITQSLKIVTLALALSIGISYVSAWTAPTVTPPNGNVSAPLNISATSQYKNGALGVGGVLHGYSDALFDGNVGIGTANPVANLNVVGQGDTNLRIQSLGTGADYDAEIDLFNKNGYWKISNDDNNNSVLNFWGGSTTANMTLKMSVLQNGNVGIGTTADPTEKLEVTGNIKASGSVCNGSGQCIGGSGAETDPTVLASVKDGIAWSEISGIPGGFSDGLDNTGIVTGGGSAQLWKALAGQTISCGGGGNPSVSASVDTNGVHYMTTSTGGFVNDTRSCFDIKSPSFAPGSEACVSLGGVKMMLIANEYYYYCSANWL